jgi:hypothetical protein
VAATVAFLCTEDSAYTSGAVFVVDGASDCLLARLFAIIALAVLVSATERAARTPF